MGNYLTRSRHGTMYHFRRRVPDDLRPLFGRSHLIRSLETDSRQQAIKRARAAAAETDALFDRLREMSEHDTDNPSKLERKTLEQLAHEWKLKHALRSQREEFEKALEDQQRAHKLEIEANRLKAENVALRAYVLGNKRSSAPLSAAPKAPASGKTLSEAWEGHKAEKISAGLWRDGEDTAKYDHWPHVRTLIDVIGDKPLTEITAEDINGFQSHVLTDPKGGSPSNREKRLMRAGAVLRWAKSKRLISDDFAELFRYPGKIKPNPYVAFDENDLKALFESEDYRHRAFRTPSEYWLPILSLHTGARLNELCQLTAHDIKTHDGVQTISILDGEIGKRLKTSASRRIIPIHSKLIELGFLDYVATIKQGRIFPELPENPKKPGNFSDKASELFTTYRRKCGVGQVSGRSTKSFHSFRSTLISALRKGGVPKDRRTRLAGHEYDDTQDSTYHGGDPLTMFDFQTLKSDIEHAKYDVEFTRYR